MKEKDDDINDKDDDLEDNIISTSYNKPNVIITKEEEQLSPEPKIFECELLKKDIKHKVNFIIKERERLIEFKLCLKTQTTDKKNDITEEKEEYIHLKTINQIDFINFFTQEEIDETTISKIKNNLFQKEGQTLLDENEICSILYIPQVTKSNCNCLRCFFCCECKCSKEYKYREYTRNYFLINKDYIFQIKKSLYNISLPKLYELQAKNRKRKILAFVNPVGGQQNGLTIWDRALKLLNKANLDLDVIITERFKQAYEYMLTVDPLKYDGFIACSGDGIIHEIINAIFHRNEEDRKKFLEHLAICAIPAGTGNALSKAISSYCGDDNSVENQCYYLCKGIKKKIDCQEIQIKNMEKKVYSIVAFFYGFLSDCDLDSECLRCIGDFRWTLMGAVRYFCLRDYLGCLYYLPQDAPDDIINTLPSINENIDDISKYGLIRKNDQWNMFTTCNLKYSSESLICHPLAEIDDGYCDMFTLPAEIGGRWPLLRWLVNDMNNGDYFVDQDKKVLKSGYDYKKTKWWRFIPKQERGNPDDVNLIYNLRGFYSIDGERYPIRPMQCRTLNKILNVFCGKE